MLLPHVFVGRRCYGPLFSHLYMRAQVMHETLGDWDTLVSPPSWMFVSKAVPNT